MEAWRRVWRDGIQPLINTPGLAALGKALAEDSERLIQGATTSPPPLACVQDWAVEAACAMSFCGWHECGPGATVGEVEGYFARLCFAADEKLGEAGVSRWFTNWFDDTPRPEMRRQLLGEVTLELNRRSPEQQEAKTA
jgi:hypothetical protein